MTKRKPRNTGAEVTNDLLPHSFTGPHKAPPPLKAKNDNQNRYIQTILHRVITYGLGPAGTGKTYIAARLAAEAFLSGDTKKIVISRPAVEAGESIGFLPGDMGEKIDPFFVPVKEVLIEVMGRGRFEYAMKAGQIEFVPLAFMRGRTFKDAWVIIDEAQNTTPLQMKMVLSRLGENSKYIINGDVMQSDIVGPNGLSDSRRKLVNIPGIGVVVFKRADIVRHGLVREIIDAYEGTSDDDEQPPLPGFITGDLTSPR